MGLIFGVGLTLGKHGISEYCSKYSCTCLLVYSWPLNNAGVRGADPPHSQESTGHFWLPRNWSCPSVSTQNWFPDPCGYPNPRMLQSPTENGIDQCIVGPPHPWTPNCESKTIQHWKKSAWVELHSSARWCSRVNCTVWQAPGCVPGNRIAQKWHDGIFCLLNTVNCSANGFTCLPTHLWEMRAPFLYIFIKTWHFQIF